MKNILITASLVCFTLVSIGQDAQVQPSVKAPAPTPSETVGVSVSKEHTHNTGKSCADHAGAKACCEKKDGHSCHGDHKKSHDDKSPSSDAKLED